MAGEVAGHAAEAAGHGIDLVPIVVLLGAAVVAVPLFKRLSLGSVLGYLAAGLLLGPSGVGLISDPVTSNRSAISACVNQTVWPSARSWMRLLPSSLV